MTALALTNSTSSPDRMPVDRDAWVPLPKAAKLLALSEGQLRRRCLDEYGPAGTAKQLKADNGRTVWHLHRCVHANLRRDHVAGFIVPEKSATLELLSYGQKKRSIADRKVLIVKRYLEWSSKPGVNAKRDFAAFAAIIQQEFGTSVSRRSVFNWRQQLPATDDATEQALALMDQRFGPVRVRSCSPEAWDLFEHLYLNPNKPSIKNVHRRVAREAGLQGWSWPKLTRVKQLVASKIDAGKACFHREGEAAFEKRHQAPMQQDPDAWLEKSCWESDHSKFDLFIRVFSGGHWVERRPWLTAWMDRRSRRLMGWHIDLVPSGDTIRYALLAALKDESVSPPEFAWLDHGKDFEQAANIGVTKSERRKLRGQVEKLDRVECEGLLGKLGIKARFALPYNHNGKARIERLFGTRSGGFDKFQPGYCGNTPGAKDRDAIDAELADIKGLLTLEQLKAKFAVWVQEYNHAADHAVTDLADPATGELLSRDGFYQRFHPRRVLADRSSLELLKHRWSKPLKVQKWGISLTIAGRVCRFGDIAPELDRFKGTDRLVRVCFDPDATESITVYDDEWRPVCVARENEEYGGPATDSISVEARKRAMAIRREQKKRAAQRPDVGAILMTGGELAAREQAKIDREKTKAALAEQGIENAPSVRIVRTPVDGQAEQVGKLERRVAVGAESMSPAAHAPRRDLAALMAQASDASSPTAPARRIDIASLQADGGTPQRPARSNPPRNLAAMQADGEGESQPRRLCIADLLTRGDQ